MEGKGIFGDTSKGLRLFSFFRKKELSWKLLFYCLSH